MAIQNWSWAIMTSLLEQVVGISVRHVNAGRMLPHVGRKMKMKMSRSEIGEGIRWDFEIMRNCQYERLRC